MMRFAGFLLIPLLLSCGSSASVFDDSCELKDGRVGVVNSFHRQKKCIDINEIYVSSDKSFELFVNKVNRNISDENIKKIERIVYIRNGLFSDQKYKSFHKEGKILIVKNEGRDAYIVFDRRSILVEHFKRSDSGRHAYRIKGDLLREEYIRSELAYAKNAKNIDADPRSFVNEYQKFSHIPLDVFWLLTNSSPGSWEAQSNAPSRYMELVEFEQVKPLAVKLKFEIGK